MFDFEIAHYLYRVHFLLKFVHQCEYKAKAYYKAALAIDSYGKDILQLYKKNELKMIPSIGVSIEKNIVEIIETNNLKMIKELLGDLPDSIFEFNELGKINDKLIFKLLDKKIYSYSKLEKLINSKVKNHFSISELMILESALVLSKKARLFQYAHVKRLAEELTEHLKKYSSIKEVSFIGKLRLASEVMESGNILCSINGDFENLVKYLRKAKSFKIICKNEKQIVLTRFNIPFIIDVIFDKWAVNLLMKTGPDGFVLNHLINLDNTLDNDEKTIFEKFNQDYIPPSCREYYQEYLKLKHSSIPIVIKGDLHAHTNWSDGLHSISEMAAEGKKRGYEYLAVTDHSISLKIASGLSELDLLKQIKEIEEYNASAKDFKIISGIEVDIKANGNLDYPDYILEKVDIVIAAIHTSLNQSSEVMYERISKALQNQNVNIFAHPTNRLLGRPGKISEGRESSEIPIDAIIKLCQENSVALEVNAFPERYDLSKENILKVLNAGVKISIGTDAHSKYHLQNMEFVEEFIRELLIDPKMILNTYSYEELIKYLQKKKTQSNMIDINLEKDFNYYFNHNKAIMNGSKKVVGIDLTGSQMKASGWSLLEGVHSLTKLIKTDEELISETIKYLPDIVSIDSPLSIPEGRCCTKADCECLKYGIMRYCELTLKRFGIGVYPCLIPSMVSLTSRGIKLAKTFRDLGIEVIESYPGVAQDLLNIPRKRKGLDYLIKGLGNFGIKGDIFKDNIVHDEVDAITSALVGYFYLDDQYVAMGNDKEDYLIVPRLVYGFNYKPNIICLVGEKASGKTLVKEYLKFKYGFKEYNNRMLIDKKTSYVVDGINSEEMLINLKKTFPELILVNISSDINTRYLRCRQIVSEQDFLKSDKELLDIISYSDYTIVNNSSFKSLMEALDDLLNEIKKEKK